MKKYQDIKVAVDIVIFAIRDGKLQTLLIQMKKKPFYRFWAFPGGLIKKTETLDQAAHRELYEKTGLRNVYLEQLYTFGELRRDPFGRVVSVAYFALIQEPKRLKPGAKYLDVRLWPVSKLPHLAYDHTKISRYALRRLRAKLQYSNVAWSLLPRAFSLGDLQKVYEIILGRKIDKRNFRKRVKDLELLKYTGKNSQGQHRPAKLYRFRTIKSVLVEVT